MIRTRFAPSPTGFLHVGGLRTALYNYLYAKKHKGEFLLRIEDTDVKRQVEGATEHLIKMLKWVGLDYDEGPKIGGPYEPYIQSKRFDTYKKYASELLNKKHAYRCFCTAERLEEMRKHQTQNKKAPMYDRHCLYLSDQEIQDNLDKQIPFVIRQKIPSAETVKFKDRIRGTMSFSAKTLDDHVLLKSDGYPTYHLANVIDDHLMKITHVIRGEEWLPSTPKHILLYRAFEWEQPEFAHIPLLLNKDRTKLSKRQGHVSLEEYIKEGYLKEAIINFIAFLGWHPGGSEENEIFTLKELEEAFSLNKVHKAGAVFDLEKLDWFNWQWKRAKYNRQLAEYAKKLEKNVQIENPKKGHYEYIFENPENKKAFFEERTGKLEQICKRFLSEKHLQNKEKLRKTLLTVEEKILRDEKNVDDYIKFYFEDIDYETELLTHQKMKVDYAMAKKALAHVYKSFENFDAFEDIQSIQNELFKVIKEMDVKNGQILWPLRAALTGEKYSPGVFEVAWVLGKQDCLKRIKKALNKLEKTI